MTTNIMSDQCQCNALMIIGNVLIEETVTNERANVTKFFSKAKLTQAEHVTGNQRCTAKKLVNDVYSVQTKTPFEKLSPHSR
jgi:hypothetical protein